MASLDRIGFCWKLSWKLRWCGSSCGGTWPGIGRAAPNGKSWHDAVNIRLTGEPRRNGWRVLARSSVAT